MPRSMKEFYDDYWQFRQDRGRVHTTLANAPERLRAVARLIHTEGAMRVLDVGCGEGALGDCLRERRGDVSIDGCDISARAVDYAAPRYRQVKVADVEAQDLADLFAGQSYDFVVCTEVLEHVFDPERLLQSCMGVLAPDGRLIVSFPNIAWWKHRLTLLGGHFPEESRLYHHAEHLHDFTMHSFSNMLERAGLIIEAMDGEFKGPNILRRFFERPLGMTTMKAMPNVFGYQVVLRTRPGRP